LLLSPPEGPGLGGGARDGSSAPLPRARKPSWRDWKSCWNFDCRQKNGFVSLVPFLPLEGLADVAEKQVATEGVGQGSYQDVKETDRNPSLLCFSNFGRFTLKEDAAWITKACMFLRFSGTLCSLLFLVALKPSKVSAEGRRTEIDGPRQLPNVELIETE
jgi:hypothetical protein